METEAIVLEGTNISISLPRELPQGPYTQTKDVFTFASDHELDYPDMLKGVDIKGGMFLSVIGGAEQVFGLIAKTEPEEIVLFDKNPYTVALMALRLRVLKEYPEQTYDEYVKKISNLLKGREPLFQTGIQKADELLEKLVQYTSKPNVPFHTPQINGDENGWASKDDFNNLKRILAKVKISLFCKDWHEVQKDILDNSYPAVSLIYLSDIPVESSTYERLFSVKFKDREKGKEVTLIEKGDEYKTHKFGGQKEGLALG